MATEQMSNDTMTDSPWSVGSPWDRCIPGFSDSDTRAKEEELAEVRPSGMTAEEEAQALAEFHAQMDAEEKETEKVPAAIGGNGLALIKDPDWVDMTARNWDYMRHVYQSSLSHRDKTVLGVVAMHCGLNSRGCSTSNETLAKEANIDKDNLRKRLSALTRDGWVRENGEMPSVRAGMSGAKIRHIGLKKGWIQGGS